MSGRPVSVIIPWLDAGDEWRARALEYTTDWWSRTHPDYQIVIAELTSDDGAWSKGLAVRRGLESATGKIIVVADADVICDGVDLSVSAVDSLTASWSVPHRRVCRLTDVSTASVYSGASLPPVPWRIGVVSPEFAEIYHGTVGGGIVVVPLGLIREVPIDPRFRGWGQEDYSWARALTMVAGHPSRGSANLFHLWHAPQKRISRGIGSADGFALWQRYQSAATLPAMMSLLDEARGALSGDGYSDDVTVSCDT